MKFWTPTKKKSATTLLLILLWLVFSAVSSLTQKTYNKYSFKLLTNSNYSNYSKELKKPIKQYIQATQSARRNISNETAGKLEMAGHLNISIQIAAGILIAYLGSCIIYRRETQGCV
ncbi:hypothetical protein [Geopseudomonas aromaticivorans]